MSTPNQSNPQTELNKVLEIIGKIVKISADGDYIFRGESQCHPKISSTLYRALEKVGLLNEHDVEAFQHQELKYAKTYRYTQKTDDFEILTEIQHFGGKTNLLDFTTDYRIALFFACNSFPFTDGRVILQDRNGAIKDWTKEPCESDPKSRVKVQKSIFIIPPDGFIEPDLEIVVSKDLKQSLLKYLEKEHEISPETIYPDLYGFVSNQETRWNVYAKIGKGIACQEKKEKADDLGKKAKYYQKAVKHFTNAIENAIQLDQGLTLAYVSRGGVYLSEGELDNSIFDFSKAIKLMPEFGEAYNNRGLAYFSKGNLENSKVDFNNAIADFSEAIELNSEFVGAHYNRGRAHFLLGEFALAIRDYSTEISLKSDRDIYYDRGVAWLHQQEWEKAKADLIVARSMEFNIIAAFRDCYKNVEKCEQLIGAKLPSDIVSLLTQP